MTGDTLLKILLTEYIVIMVAYLFQRNWAKAIYFLGAAIISTGVLWMK